MSDLTVIELNETQRMMLEQKTAPQLIRFRAGRGGKQYPFVDIAEVIRALNDAFNWDWDFETDQEEILHVQGKPFEVKVRGRLTVRVSGRQLVKMQYGAQAIEFKKDSDEPVSLADCYKGAASDALKKCASELGLFLDLYDSDANITPQSVENAKRAQLQSATPPQWTRDPAEWAEFAKHAKQFGLTAENVRELLGVKSMHDYTGTRADAEAKVKEWADATEQQKSDVPVPVNGRGVQIPSKAAESH